MENEYVTVEYLLERGFEKYDKTKKVEGLPFYNEDDIHLIEKEFNRRMFVIIFFSDDPDNYLVYVQQDAGCGFVLIPFAWSGLPVDHFESLYYAIRGNKTRLING